MGSGGESAMQADESRRGFWSSGETADEQALVNLAPVSTFLAIGGWLSLIPWLCVLYVN